MNPVFSWGRLGAQQHELSLLSDPERISNQVCGKKKVGLAHGMGRSYGDVCLNPNGLLWLTKDLDHLISFDDQNGLLICEAGVLLKDIQRLFIPRGWMLPVTPGSEIVTVGGAIANDVHGKNHHFLGSFGNHVKKIKLLRTSHEIIECSPSNNPEWFAATIGGVGLTGVIMQAEIQLRPAAGPWLEVETIPHEKLEDFFQIADESETSWEYSVSWIDCLAGKTGRGIFMRANSIKNSPREEFNYRSKSLPFIPPLSLVNKLTLKPFNTAYYYLKKRGSGSRVVHYKSFFYPLDTLSNWNLMYGPKGFFQHQSVIPVEFRHEAIEEMLKVISKSGEGSFLAVLKTFGKRKSIGLLSFPHPGVTLALDFPNRGQCTHRLLERLDSIVLEAKGRIYPAKDACMSRKLFEAGYPLIDDFIKYRDPNISSGLSRRLMGN